MSLSQSENVILHILKGKPKTGKTAVMKIVYLLQQVKQIKVGYNFDIYTYGPYASEVAEHLDNLVYDELVTSCVYCINNYVGYELSVSEKGKERMEELSSEDQRSIQDILNFADGKTAKDLELYSTIVFINHLYHTNRLSNGRQRVIEKVHEIKPHFNIDTISDAYNILSDIKYIPS